MENTADFGDELAFARASVLVIPAPETRAIVVRGADRASWLNGLVTCDVTKLEPKKALYGLVVTKKGRVVADLVILDRRDALVLLVPASAEAALLEIFDHHLVMEDVELAKSAPRVWHAHGPRARDLPGEVFDFDRTGLGGAIVLADDEAELTRAARELGGAIGSEAAWEALRVERAVPRFGRDFDDQTYPQEAALEKVAVSFDKGCYLGQEVVCMLELRGHVKRKLVPVELSAPAEPQTPLTDEKGAEIGRLTSVSGTRALAMIKLAHAAPGTTLRASTVTATVR